MVVFERFMNFRKTGGNHCQLNVIPVPASASAGAKAAVQKTASFHGFDLQAVPGASKVGALLCSSMYLPIYAVGLPGHCGHACSPVTCPALTCAASPVAARCMSYYQH